MENRRQFFRRLALQKQLLPAPTPLNRAAIPPPVAVVAPRPPTTTGINLYTGTYGKKEILHLLRRTLYGTSMASYNTFKNLSLDDAVELLLTEAPTPPDPVNDYNNAGYDINDTNVPLGETWVNAPHGQNIEYWRELSYKSYLLDLAINQNSSIHEKMILFWHNHLATETFAIFDARLSYRHFNILRQRALGNFKTMVREVTTDPLMLYYLNGTYNNQYQPDENYARELQELFCIGKGPDSAYTEDDVQAAARVLTGWSVNWDTGGLTSTFAVWAHDTGDKQFSDFYNNTLIQGQSGTDGANELDQLLDMVFATNECAKHVCRKIYRFFVYHTIDQSVEDLVIAPLADIFRNNNYEIKPVLRALLKSEHFFDMANRGAIIKSPMDYMMGAFREFDFQLPPTATDGYELRKHLYWTAEDMLQGIGDPPNVAGWPAYYQAPSYNKQWATTATLPKRAMNSDRMLYWGFDVFGTVYRIDPVALTTQIPNAADPNLLINNVLGLMLAVPVSDTVKQSLKNDLLSGESSDYYWTDAWNNYLANPTDEMAYGTVHSRLRAMYRQIMQLEEYQLM
ncbi:MAG: DUF1800 domain-containing protein [Chitinophagales bacterium]|nr:DUF1800 domain-containing protein [Chitinophagales bacterium]